MRVSGSSSRNPTHSRLNVTPGDRPWVSGRTCVQHVANDGDDPPSTADACELKNIERPVPLGRGVHHVEPDAALSDVPDDASVPVHRLLTVPALLRVGRNLDADVFV